MTTKNTKKPGSASELPGFFRYIAAIFYDLLLVIAIFFLATALLLPFNNGEAVQSPILYPLYLLVISFIFYGWFWTHGGQTLGLRAWKLRLSNSDQTDISWKQALIRYLTASISWLTFGLGIVWRLWHKDQKTWQDLSSHSYITLAEEKKPS